MKYGITKDELHPNLLQYIQSASGNGGSSSFFRYLKSNTTLVQNSNEAEIGIEGFDSNTDLLLVYKNSIYIENDVDYTISSDNLKIVITGGETWNSGTQFNFICFKNVPELSDYSIDGSKLDLKSVSLDKLDETLQGSINKANDWDTFKTNGGNINGSIIINGGTDLRAFGNMRTMGSKDYKSIFGVIGTGTDGTPSAQIKLENITDSKSVGISLTESELVPTVSSILNIGNTSFPFSSLYLSSGIVMSSANTIRFVGNDQKQVYICASDSRNDEGKQQCDIVLIKNDANTGFSLRPTTNGRDYTSIGASTHKFSNAYFSGDVYIDGVSKSTNGYTKLSNGLILQWGEFTITDTSTADARYINFPVTFPNNCFTVTGNLSTHDGNTNPRALSYLLWKNNTANFFFRVMKIGLPYESSATTAKCTWMAIGN